MSEGVDTVVLRNELAFHGDYPLDWRPLQVAPDAATLEAMDAANAQLLQACIAAEEPPPLREKNEELLPLAQELARLDAKLNLVLQMLATLVAQNNPEQKRPIRFNATGATWTALAPLPTVASTGVLRIRLQPAIPQSLELACQVLEVDGAEVSVQYLRLSEHAAESMQRLCFLRHRKQVAGARKSRNS